jgi:tRNA threonylcarbamoyladenosine biosynthesis protein TsaE
MQEVTLSLKNTLATQNLGDLLGRLLPAGSTILLEGDLGAGKTTLVGGIGHGLGILEPIVSPTFTIVNEYLEGNLPLYHLDLYRLEGSEIESIYPEIYWEGKEVMPGITAIEWSERLTFKPPNHLKLKLIYDENGTRKANLLIVGNLDFSLEVLVDRDTKEI